MEEDGEEIGRAAGGAEADEGEADAVAWFEVWGVLFEEGVGCWGRLVGMAEVGVGEGGKEVPIMPPMLPKPICLGFCEVCSMENRWGFSYHAVPTLRR